MVVVMLALRNDGTLSAAAEKPWPVSGVRTCHARRHEAVMLCLIAKVDRIDCYELWIIGVDESMNRLWTTTLFPDGSEDILVQSEIG
jgi:hypothetical protein